MVRLTIALAICFFCVLEATAQDSHTISPCDGFNCDGDKQYNPICTYDAKNKCYLTNQNYCHVILLWCRHGPQRIFKESACDKDLPACDPSKYAA